MRVLSACLTLMAIALCFLLIACGEEGNPVNPGPDPEPEPTTFWVTYDRGLTESLLSLAQHSTG